MIKSVGLGCQLRLWLKEMVRLQVMVKFTCYIYELQVRTTV